MRKRKRNNHVIRMLARWAQDLVYLSRNNSILAETSALEEVLRRESTGAGVSLLAREMVGGGRDGGEQLISCSSNGTAGKDAGAASCQLRHMRSRRTAALALIFAGPAAGFIYPSAVALGGGPQCVVAMFVGK